MSRRSKGRRRGSRPWKPGVRSLTSADPARKRSLPKPEARACESCCQLFEPPAGWPSALLCLPCYVEEKQYQKSLARRYRPPVVYTPKGNPATKNADWLTREQSRMVREAVARRMPG